MSEPTEYHFADFTEAGYMRLIHLAKKHYPFSLFHTCKEMVRCVLWRHDVDMSLHRALSLARIEHSESVTTTYFIHVHSEFYHALDLESQRIVTEIKKLGHEIGLHFDPGFYRQSLEQRPERLDEFLEMEKRLLEVSYGCEVRVFSIHNPDVGPWMDLIQDDVMAGMVNTYGRYFRDNFAYCSDSNGYWRFRRMFDLLAEADSARLHILTHPEWWVPDPTSPRDRVSRCIDGRAAYQHRSYDEFLSRVGRQNVR